MWCNSKTELTIDKSITQIRLDKKYLDKDEAISAGGLAILKKCSSDAIEVKNTFSTNHIQILMVDYMCDLIIVSV